MTGGDRTNGRLLGSPVIYIAGAGTGKTYQLIEDFYAALQASSFDPSRLLALTFTENAASEMRERIREKLLAEQGLSALPLAQELAISTIHSFCRIELDRHALVAGLSPRFAVLDEPESQTTARRVLLSILVERFDGESKRARSALVREARFNSYFRSAEFGVSLEDEILRVYSQLRAQGVMDFNSLALDVSDSSWEESCARLVGAVDEVLATPAETMTGKSREKLARLQMLLREGQSELKGIAADRDGFALLSELASSIDLRGSDAYKELLAPFRDELIPLCQRQILQHRLPEVRDELVEILAELDECLAAEKASRNVLDFDDLQLRFLRLLREHPEVAERYRRRLHKVFVDEFQDTNPLQVALIDALAGPQAQYLVGDPKQAIYAFRYADPEGVVRKREAFAASSGIVGKLQDNHRSRPEILRFVNDFFHQLEADEGGSPMGFIYEEVQPARSFAGKKSPSVEFVCLSAGGDGELSAEQRQQMEANWVAGYLHETVERGLIPRTREGTSGTLSYGDFAILVRRNRSIPAFEEALAAAGIPFISETSSGFLETPEITALADSLKLLLTPDVDMLAAQVLRSDLVGVSSSGLFELMTARAVSKQKREPLLDVLERSDSLLSSEADRQAVSEFRDWFGELRSRLPFLTPAEMVREIISRSRLQDKLVAHSDASRALLNLTKFTDIALNVSGQGIAALAELTSQLRELSYQRAQMGQMWVEKGDFVRIMSVHKAKGLTIGAVVVADVNFRLPKSQPTFIVQPAPDGDGLRLGIKQRLAGSPVGDEEFYAEGIQRVEAGADAEELRLLYVALTRAVEHLTVVGVPTPESGRLGANHWGRRLAGLLHRGEGGKLTLETPFADLVQLTELARSEMEDVPSIQSAHPSFPELISQHEANVSSEDELLAHQLLAEAEQSPDLGGFSRYIFSVSEFLSWAASPEEFSLRGSPSWVEDEIPRSEREDEYAPSGESGEAARQLGILVHELLAVACEHLREVSPEELASSALSGEFLAKWLPERKEAVALAKDQLGAMLSAFARSDIFSALKRARKAYPEFGFLLRRDRSLFRGRVDLLLVGDTEVVLVDFKSDRLLKESAIEDAAARYRDQLLFYARAIRSLYPAMTVSPLLLFLDGGLTWRFKFEEGDFAALDARLDEFIMVKAERLREEFLALTDRT